MTATLDATPTTHRPFPPVSLICTISLALVVVGGIIIASYAPRRPPLLAPTLLLIASVVLFAVAVFLLARTRDFAWSTFNLVGKWALLAYVISGGMIEFAFVKNDTRGATLLVVTLLLIMFVVNVPTIIAFTVARYQDPSR